MPATSSAGMSWSWMPRPGAGEDLATGDQRFDIRKSAHEHRIHFPAAPIDLNAGNALQSVGHGVVRQLADIFSDDRVDNLGRVALDLLGAPQRRTNAGNNNDVTAGVGLQRPDRHRRSPALLRSWQHCSSQRPVGAPRWSRERRSVQRQTWRRSRWRRRKPGSEAGCACRSSPLARRGFGPAHYSDKCCR